MNVAIQSCCTSNKGGSIPIEKELASLPTQTQAGFDQLSGVAQMFVQAPSDVPLSRAQLRHVLRGTLVALYEVFKFVKLLATILQNLW